MKSLIRKGGAKGWKRDRGDLTVPVNTRALEPGKRGRPTGSGVGPSRLVQQEGTRASARLRAEKAARGAQARGETAELAYGDEAEDEIPSTWGLRCQRNNAAWKANGPLTSIIGGLLTSCLCSGEEYACSHAGEVTFYMAWPTCSLLTLAYTNARSVHARLSPLRWPSGVSRALQHMHILYGGIFDYFIDTASLGRRVYQPQVNFFLCIWYYRLHLMLHFLLICV